MELENVSTQVGAPGLPAISGFQKKPSLVSLWIVRLQRLVTMRLTVPLDVILEPDGDGFIARPVDLPLYGFGDDTIEALEMLKRSIESLYNELMEDDNFSPEWLLIKQFLKERVVLGHEEYSVQQSTN
ncbi:MAG: hypothetical protein HQK60_02005 [Deltaproteobacteria bacterium]|nr:hypothetical protein [Deltaproteobacteria bacterium]